MKRVLVIGATGRAGEQVISFLKNEDLELTLVSRSITENQFPDVTAKRLAFDATALEPLTQAVKDQDIIVAVSNGDALAQSQSLLKALEASQSQPERIIWLTGMGIHGEVPGEQGRIYEQYVKAMPTYIEAADAIADSAYPSVLLRAPLITEKAKPDYQLLPEGVPLPSQEISYTAIGHAISDMITGKVQLDGKDSLGIVQ